MELNNLKIEIQKIQEKIKILATEKGMCVENKQDENDDGLLDCELNQLERELEWKTGQYNNAVQLKNYQSVCEHVFIEDLIDLNPDESTTIEYCVHCLLEKK